MHIHSSMPSRPAMNTGYTAAPIRTHLSAPTAASFTRVHVHRCTRVNAYVSLCMSLLVQLHIHTDLGSLTPVRSCGRGCLCVRVLHAGAWMCMYMCMCLCLDSPCHLCDLCWLLHTRVQGSFDSARLRYPDDQRVWTCAWHTSDMHSSSTSHAAQDAWMRGCSNGSTLGVVSSPRVWLWLICCMRMHVGTARVCASPEAEKDQQAGERGTWGCRRGNTCRQQASYV